MEERLDELRQIQDTNKGSFDEEWSALLWGILVSQQHGLHEVIHSAPSTTT